MKVLFLARRIYFSHFLFEFVYDGDRCDKEAYRALELVVRYDYKVEDTR